jgi:hypothetical protein
MIPVLLLLPRQELQSIVTKHSKEAVVSDFLVQFVVEVERV